VQNGQAYILANPRLVTRSGGTATFLAGGEVPIPVSAGFGAVSVTYKNYGVKLKIQPDVDHQGNILATVDTAISQINPALTVQGYPAFLTRKTDSVVNVHSGQTIVLSGLIHATGANSINKLPWLGDIPILGTLFRDTQFQHNQSELVIFVTPEVINPNSPANRAMIRQGRQKLQNQGAPTTTPPGGTQNGSGGGTPGGQQNGNGGGTVEGCKVSTLPYWSTHWPTSNP
jgi:pilus assembly protein CpaC